MTDFIGGYMLLTNLRKSKGAGHVVISAEGMGYSVKMTDAQVEMVMSDTGKLATFSRDKVTIVGRDLLEHKDREWVTHMDRELDRWVPCWVNNLCQARR